MLCGVHLQWSLGEMYRLPIHKRDVQDTQPCSHMRISKGTLETPFSTVMFLDWGRKLEYPDRTHTCMRRTFKPQAKRPQAGIQTQYFFLEGNSANNYATVQPSPVTFNFSLHNQSMFYIRGV
ncbi:hypothetical protein XENORESO_016354 [Xenotaenia resolanae]|uniref:Uncharacterized protein n=1 Tax=Xenotaenia resolanae TaxID=208358 RepID=A0ABV0WCA0_9TELE